jgi:2-phospho-L-lactate guanylyltransferase
LRVQPAVTLRIVIPVRPRREGKSRLGPALKPAARALLVERMFRHVVEVAQQCGPTWVVSRDPVLLVLSAQSVVETGFGLNPALEQAAAGLAGGDPVLALSADLPLLTSSDLVAMVGLLAEAEVVAAPDRTGTGTNALLLARPGLIPYRFGEGSLAAHRAAAEANGLRFAICERAGLGSRPSESDSCQLSRSCLRA